MKEKLKNKKVVVVSSTLLIMTIIVLLVITLKDSYAYYGNSNELEIMKATIGKLKPTIDKVYIETENQQYTNKTNPNVAITWSDDNITEYCVTLDSNCTEFTQLSDTDTSKKSVTVPITLNGEGNHTVYAYIKNKYGYTSLAGQSSITLDTIPPTVSYAPTSGTYSPKQVITVTPYDSGSGVGAWAVHVYKARALDYSNKDFVKSVDGLTNQASYSVTLEEGTWTIYTIVYDKAGNVINPDPKERADWHYEEYTIKNPSVPAKDAILANRPQSLESEDALTARNATITGGVKDDLMRFVGTYEEVTDNFICFGTSDQNQCKQNMDTYMYRIIGIDTSGRLKLIKATKIDNNGRTTFEWQSGLAVTEKWDKSSLYNGLNDGYFMQNSNYNYMQQTQ